MRFAGTGLYDLRTRHSRLASSEELSLAACRTCGAGAQGGPFVTERQEAHAFGSLLRFAITFDPTPALTAGGQLSVGGPPGRVNATVLNATHTGSNTMITTDPELTASSAAAG